MHQPITDLLLPHLACLKINTGTLTLADGVSEFVKKYSEKIISIDRGTRGDAAERPGLLSVPSITPPVAGDLMAAAVAMYEAQPWRGIPEHLALEIRLPEDNDAYRRRYYATVLGSDEKVYGIALVASLKNLRDKYCRAMLGKMSDSDESDDETVPIIRETRMGDDDIFLCACCGKRVGETVSDDGGRYVERCVGCQRLLYCNQTCQKLDWRERHREECNEAKTNGEYVFKREKWAWLRREVALLFLDPTAIPFDDLDAYEEHGWRYVDASPTLYAMPFVTVQGSTSMSNRMDRPTLQEIIDLTLITKALTECVSPPPTEGILHLASGVSIAVAENLADSSRR